MKRKATGSRAFSKIKAGLEDAMDIQAEEAERVDSGVHARDHRQPSGGACREPGVLEVGRVPRVRLEQVVEGA